MSEREAAHLDEVLGDFGDALLALVNGKVWPVDELFVDLLGDETDDDSRCRSRRRTLEDVPARGP